MTRSQLETPERADEFQEPAFSLKPVPILGPKLAISDGAGSRIRTDDLLITKQLYRLS